MARIDTIAFGVAAALFAVFIANVVAGALAGAAFLSDVAEMLTLFVATISFVIGTLRRETVAKERATR